MLPLNGEYEPRSQSVHAVPSVDWLLPASQVAHSFCALEALVLLKHCHFARELRPDRHVLARRSVGYGHDSTLVVSAGRLACPRRWPEHGCSFGLTWRALMLLVNEARRRIVSSLSTWLGGARSASEEVCVAKEL